MGWSGLVVLQQEARLHAVSEWFFGLFPAKSVPLTVLVISLVAATGLALGSIKVKGFSLGIPGVMFTGLAIGRLLGKQNLNEEMIGFVRDFGLILFVYAVGVQVGPGFLASLRRQGFVVECDGGVDSVAGGGVGGGDGVCGSRYDGGCHAAGRKGGGGVIRRAVRRMRRRWDRRRSAEVDVSATARGGGVQGGVDAARVYGAGVCDHVSVWAGGGDRGDGGDAGDVPGEAAGGGGGDWRRRRRRRRRNWRAEHRGGGTERGGAGGEGTAGDWKDGGGDSRV